MGALELDGATGWHTEKDAFVAVESTVDLDIASSGVRTRGKGGQGFILEWFSGHGTVLIAEAGDFTR